MEKGPGLRHTFSENNELLSLAGDERAAAADEGFVSSFMDSDTAVHVDLGSKLLEDQVAQIQPVSDFVVGRSDILAIFINGELQAEELSRQSRFIAFASEPQRVE